MSWIGSSVAGALTFIVLWYFIFLRWHRRRAEKLLVQIDSAFAGNGHVSQVQWLSASKFQVQLHLANCGFTQSNVTVRFLPRELPLSWVASVWKQRRETLTFDANLPCPPGFNLEVHNQRWLGKTKRRLSPKSRVVRLQHLGPFILTSRRDWQRDVTNMVHVLSASRGCDLVSVAFSRAAPHFSATLPLETISKQNCAPVKILDVLRELASGASATRF